MGIFRRKLRDLRERSSEWRRSKPLRSTELHRPLKGVFAPSKPISSSAHTSTGTFEGLRPIDLETLDEKEIQKMFGLTHAGAIMVGAEFKRLAEMRTPRGVRYHTYSYDDLMSYIRNWFPPEEYGRRVYLEPKLPVLPVEEYPFAEFTPAGIAYTHRSMPAKAWRMLTPIELPEYFPNLKDLPPDYTLAVRSYIYELPYQQMIPYVWMEEYITDLERRPDVEKELIFKGAKFTDRVRRGKQLIGWYMDERAKFAARKLLDPMVRLDKFMFLMEIKAMGLGDEVVKVRFMEEATGETRLVETTAAKYIKRLPENIKEFKEKLGETLPSYLSLFKEIEDELQEPYPVPRQVTNPDELVVELKKHGFTDDEIEVLEPYTKEKPLVRAVPVILADYVWRWDLAYPEVALPSGKLGEKPPIIEKYNDIVIEHHPGSYLPYTVVDTGFRGAEFDFLVLGSYKTLQHAREVAVRLAKKELTSEKPLILAGITITPQIKSDLMKKVMDTGYEYIGAIKGDKIVFEKRVLSNMIQVPSEDLNVMKGGDYYFHTHAVDMESVPSGIDLKEIPKMMGDKPILFAGPSGIIIMRLTHDINGDAVAIKVHEKATEMVRRTGIDHPTADFRCFINELRPTGVVLEHLPTESGEKYRRSSYIAANGVGEIQKELIYAMGEREGKTFTAMELDALLRDRGVHVKVVDLSNAIQDLISRGLIETDRGVYSLASSSLGLPATPSTPVSQYPPEMYKKPYVPPDVKRIAEKHNIPIPMEGPEPGERPSELAPERYETKGVTWATGLVDGWCKAFTKKPDGTVDEGAYESCVIKMLPKVLEKRSKWEQKTAKGVKEFIEKARGGLASTNSLSSDVKREVEELKCVYPGICYTDTTTPTRTPTMPTTRGTGLYNFPTTTPEPAKMERIMKVTTKYCTKTADNDGKEYEVCVLNIAPMLADKIGVWKTDVWDGLSKVLEQDESALKKLSPKLKAAMSELYGVYPEGGVMFLSSQDKIKLIVDKRAKWTDMGVKVGLQDLGVKWAEEYAVGMANFITKDPMLRERLAVEFFPHALDLSEAYVTAFMHS